jgi:hypothetical protein
MAKDFLVGRHHFVDFDAARKAASGLDVDQETGKGERVVAEIETGPTPKRGDYEKLKKAKAQAKYYFVLDRAAFESAKEHQKDIPGVVVVLLPQGETFVAKS